MFKTQIKTIYRRINGDLKKESTKNVFFLSGGHLVGQLLLFISMPLLARLYSPSEWGILGTYVSIISVISVIAMFRYEYAIPIAADDIEAANIIMLCIIISLCISAFSSLILIIIAGYLNLSFLQDRTLVILIPVGIFFLSVYQSLSYWNTRKQEFRLLGKTKIIQNIGMTVIQLLLGLINMGFSGLVIGHIFGQSGGISSLISGIYSTHREAIKGITIQGIYNAAIKFQRFPKYSILAALLNALTLNLPLLYITTIFGPTEAGWYTIGLRFFIPLSLLSLGIGQVFFGEIAKIKNDPQKVLGIFRVRLTILFIISFTIIILLNLVIKDIVRVFFGLQWQNTIDCFRIISPMMLFTVVASPWNNVLDVFQRQDLHLIRESIRITLIVVILAITYYTNTDWITTLTMISGATSIGYIICLIFTWIVLK